MRTRRRYVAMLRGINVGKAKRKRAACVWSPEGILNSRLFAVIDKSLEDSVTTRNWATMVKLSALLAAP